MAGKKVVIEDTAKPNTIRASYYDDAGDCFAITEGPVRYVIQEILDQRLRDQQGLAGGRTYQLRMVLPRKRRGQ